MAFAETADAPAPVECPLFFIPKEMVSIDDLLRQMPEKNENQSLHLGAVVHYGPDNWMVWLQGRKWTLQTDESNLHIVAVKPNKVRLSLTSENSGEPVRMITLHPHQNYRLSGDSSGK